MPVLGQHPPNLTRGSSTDASYILFSSDWNECLVGFGRRGQHELVIELPNEASYSPDAGATHVSAFQRQTAFLLWSSHDIGLRRPEYFVALEGVRSS